MQTDLKHDFTTIKYPARGAAEELIAGIKKGDSVQVYKVPQAGASTNILGVCADTLDERICIMVPTTNSVTEVIKNVIEHCHKPIKYVEMEELENGPINNDGECQLAGHIPGNDKCVLLQDLVEEHPAVKELPLPLKKCNEDCPCWKSCINSWMLDVETKIIGITKAKLAACLMVEKRDQLKANEGTEGNGKPKISLGTLQLREIRKAGILIHDEGHTLEYPDSRHLEIYNASDKEALDLDNRFESIINSEEESWKSLKSVIEEAKKILENQKLKEKVDELIEKIAHDTKYSKIQSCKIRNPGFVDTHSLETIEFYMGVSEELIQLIVEIDNEEITGLRHDDVYLLRDIFYMMGCRDLNLVQYNDNGKSFIGLIVIDYYIDSLLRRFIKDINDRYHKNIFLSATYGDFNYNSLLPYGKKMKQVIFGKEGDPTRSCSRQVIVPDGYKLQHDGRNSLYARMTETMQRVVAILDQHGSHNCVILASSAREMKRIRDHPLIAGGMFWWITSGVHILCPHAIV